MPADAVTVALPSFPPLQETLTEVTVAKGNAGPLILTTCVCEQPLASVTVAIYIPMGNPVAVCVS